MYMTSALDRDGHGGRVERQNTNKGGTFTAGTDTESVQNTGTVKKIIETIGQQIATIE